MPEESRTRRLAILIDADNTSPRIAAREGDPFAPSVMLLG
jgi:hypothetical protein